MNIFKKSYKYGFTLVELLVVITIIAILVSVSFKAASVMNERSAVAQTSKRLIAISNCIGEYYAEYGQYPPANDVKYYDWTGEAGSGNKPANWLAIVKEERKNNPNFASDIDGLTYYFRHELNENIWNQYKDNVGLWWDGTNITMFLPQTGDISFTNNYYELHDAWDRNFIYASKEPFTSYILYSHGPLTSTGDDDINANQKY